MNADLMKVDLNAERAGQDKVLIEASGLTLTYGAGRSAFTALHDIDLQIRENEFFTLLGPSGCGKTSLLRVIAGFEQASAGTLKLAGQDIRAWPPYRRPINTVFQSYALFPHMSVAQNVAFGLEERRRPRAEVASTVAETLALVRLSELRDRRPDQLSGGQQQRVALARALANRPRVLLLDESLSALDFKLRKEMQLELKALQAQTGITFVFVTHDQDEALTLSDRLAVLREGRIEQIGTPGDLYDRPRTRYVADFVGDMNFLQVRARGASALLEGWGSLPLALPVPDGEGCTLAVRPERAALHDLAPGLPVRVSRVVYSGSDTVYHLDLPGQEPFRVRCQNRSGADSSWNPGDTPNLILPLDALQALRS